MNKYELLTRLKLLLGVKDDGQNEMLDLLISKSIAAVLNYTNRDELPARLEGVVLDLAMIAYNRLGTEGEQARSEGGISHSFTDGLPKEIQMQLSGYIKAKVVR